MITILEDTIQFNPHARSTITEILANPYFDDIREPAKEAPANIPASFAFEDIEDITLDQIREYFITQVDQFNP
jgi:hypothetical protein